MGSGKYLTPGQHEAIWTMFLKGMGVYQIEKESGHCHTAIYRSLYMNPMYEDIKDMQIYSDNYTDYTKGIMFGAKEETYYKDEEDIDQFTNLRFKWN